MCPVGYHLVYKENYRISCEGWGAICRKLIRCASLLRSKALFLDINECNSAENNCAHNQICINTEGSYACACPSGYLQNTDPSGSCIGKSNLYKKMISEAHPAVLYVRCRVSRSESHRLSRCAGEIVGGTVWAGDMTGTAQHFRQSFGTSVPQKSQGPLSVPEREHRSLT